MTSKSKKVIQTVGTCVGFGTLIGAVTNMINGAVSPLYFQTIMKWDNIENIWGTAVAQGIFEGIIQGILFSAIFAAVVGMKSKDDETFVPIFKFISVISLMIIGSWCVGGGIAIGLSLLSPEFYQNAFIGVPEETNQMVRYAWVGGSIWGAMFGGLLTVILGSVLFAKRRKI